MEKAILKTLFYADIFDYPLKIWELHKWLIGRKVTLYQVEKVVEKLVQSSKFKVKSGYYFLPRRAGLVGKRIHREKQSSAYLKKAQLLTSLLKLIPWIKLVGISGGLAMENATKADDIDLFIITSKNRLWLSRFLALILISLTGQRRKVGETGRKIAGKLCINTLLEEDKLEQGNKDSYLAHEVLQMKVLWQRSGIYSKYLLDNQWAFKFLPNWVGDVSSNKYNVLSIKSKRKIHNTKYIIPNTILDVFESLAKNLQLKIMGKPQGMERIEDGALYFHPNDIRPQVLAEYKQKIRNF